MIDIFAQSAAPTRRHRFVIYLPTKRRDGEPVDGFEELAMAAESLICERLGGVTSYPARGAFQGESGAIQREPIQVLESYCDETHWGAEARFLGALAQILARELDQESVACSLDGAMALVVPDASLKKQIADFQTCTPELLNSLALAILDGPNEL
jgi:hypothetical protein